MWIQTGKRLKNTQQRSKYVRTEKEQAWQLKRKGCCKGSGSKQEPGQRVCWVGRQKRLVSKMKNEQALKYSDLQEQPAWRQQAAVQQNHPNEAGTGGFCLLMTNTLSWVNPESIHSTSTNPRHHYQVTNLLWNKDFPRFCVLQHSGKTSTTFFCKSLSFFLSKSFVASGITSRSSSSPRLPTNTQTRQSKLEAGEAFLTCRVQRFKPMPSLWLTSHQQQMEGEDVSRLLSRLSKKRYKCERVASIHQESLTQSRSWEFDPV